MNSSEVHSLAFRLGALVAAILLASRIELGALQMFVQGVLLNSAAWESLFLRVLHVDEVVLIGTTRSGNWLLSDVSGFGDEVVAMFAALVTAALITGRRRLLALVEKVARRRAFALRRGCCEKSFHYTCDQFWLRIQGR